VTKGPVKVTRKAKKTKSSIKGTRLQTKMPDVHPTPLADLAPTPRPFDINPLHATTPSADPHPLPQLLPWTRGDRSLPTSEPDAKRVKDTHPEEDFGEGTVHPVSEDEYIYFLDDKIAFWDYYLARGATPEGGEPKFAVPGTQPALKKPPPPGSTLPPAKAKKSANPPESVRIRRLFSTRTKAEKLPPPVSTPPPAKAKKRKPAKAGVKKSRRTLAERANTPPNNLEGYTEAQKKAHKNKLARETIN
jgi:hypothetical protein